MVSLLPPVDPGNHPHRGLHGWRHCDPLLDSRPRGKQLLAKTSRLVMGTRSPDGKLSYCHSNNTRTEYGLYFVYEFHCSSNKKCHYMYEY